VRVLQAQNRRIPLRSRFGLTAQAAMLRDRTGDREEALGVLRRRFADLEGAVDELASALPEAGTSLEVAVAQVQERMAAMREAFASSGVPEPESRSTSR